MRTTLAVALFAIVLPLAALQPPPLSIATQQSEIPIGMVGSAYVTVGGGFQFTATGGNPPYNWSPVSGLLPYGLSFSTGTGGGLLSGIPEGCNGFWNGTSNPTVPCDFAPLANPTTAACNNNTFDPMVCAFTVQVTDNSSPPQTAMQSFTVSVYWNPPLQNPLQTSSGTITPYLTTQAGYFAQMSQASGGLPVSPIQGGGHLVIANPIFRNPAYDNQAAWNAWIDAMRAAGMTIVNIEPDLECIVDNRASCLALYGNAITHAHNLGMTVSINPVFYANQSCGDAGCGGQGVPSNGMLGACFNGFGITINGGSYGSYGSGVHDWYQCVASMNIPNGNVTAYQYILQTWLSPGDRFVPVHEPTTQAGGWMEGTFLGPGCSTNPGTADNHACSGVLIPPGTSTSNNTCPSDWVSNFLQLFFAQVVHWNVPKGVSYGVTVNSLEMSGGINSYAYAFATSQYIPTSVAMGVDVYSFEPRDQSLYTTTINKVFLGNGHSAFVEEFGPQAWVYTGSSVAPTGESCAIVGIQSCTWNSLNQNFSSSLLSFVANLGVTDASLYGTEILGACTPIYPDNGHNPTTFANATTAMLNRQYSLCTPRLSAILSAWNAASLTGGTLIGGSIAPKPIPLPTN